MFGSSGEVSLIENDWPSASSPWVVGSAMNAGSAWVVAELRCEARGRGDRRRKAHVQVDPVHQDLRARW